MTREIISTGNAPKPRGPYSQAVKAGGFVFVAGQLPLTPDGALVGERDIGQQAEVTLANMAAILREAGSSMDKVVKTTVFLTNLDDFTGMNAVYERSFPAPYPARSTIEVSRLPGGMLVEIECVALA